MAFPLFLVLYRSQMTFLGLNGKNMEKAFLNEGLSQAKLCVGGCKALRWRLQSFALAIAKLCVGSCKALRRKVQCFA